MPYKVFLIDAGEYPRKSASPDVELGLQILHDIKQVIGDDIFGLRVLEMYQNNFNDPDYEAAFRVLLRELMVSDTAFFEKMREFGTEETQSIVSVAHQQAADKRAVAGRAFRDRRSDFHEVGIPIGAHG